MITREEAIAYFEKILAGARQGLERHPEEGKRVYGMRKELSEIAIAALHPISRERVEKVWRGCEKCNGAGEYSRYAENLTKTLLAKYCPHCGRPLTDEAVDMVMERLEALCGQASD